MNTQHQLAEALRMAAGFIESGESAGHTFFEVREAWRNALEAHAKAQPALEQAVAALEYIADMPLGKAAYRPAEIAAGRLEACRKRAREALAAINEAEGVTA